jgi:hypothetical protein
MKIKALLILEENAGIRIRKNPWTSSKSHGQKESCENPFINPQASPLCSTEKSRCPAC